MRSSCLGRVLHGLLRRRRTAPRGLARTRTAPGTAARRGFTLLEVLVAAGLLAVGVLGLVAAVVRSGRAVTRAADDTTAAGVARSVAAALRLGAREHAYAVWEEDPASPGRTRASRAFFFFPHPAALGPRGLPLVGDGTTRAVSMGAFAVARADASCVVLPLHGERVTYPAPVASSSDPEAVPPTFPVGGDRTTDTDRFNLTLERCEVDGQPAPGLYRVTVRVFRGLAAAPQWVFTTENFLMAGPTAVGEAP